ncbi:unnamed protein product [Larinioides sclopetarius]|uniref:Uncharacterized protein n=1 Tax=Larinioides sclopetarius TaxID=280406 RepID=A0AAV2BST6_9ARAC
MVKKYSLTVARVLVKKEIPAFPDEVLPCNPFNALPLTVERRMADVFVSMIMASTNVNYHLLC